MGYTCAGGQFDGYTLTTERDRQLCTEGGGEIRPGSGPSNDGCAGETVSNFSAATGRPVNIAPLYAAQATWERTEQMQLLTQLAAVSVPAVEAIQRDDPELADELSNGLNRLASVCTAVLNPDSSEVVYTEDDHVYFSELARRVAEHGDDGHLSDLLDQIIMVAGEFRGLDSRAIHDQLGVPLPEMPEANPTETDVQLPIPAALFQHEPGHEWKRPWEQPITDVTWDRTPVFELLVHLLRAERAIDEKARSLGVLAAAPQGSVTALAEGGFVQRFADCDIYYSPDTGAHEVHGEIRRKYNIVNGPIRLGLPVTDESGCPDGVGRFNHFSKQSSIYWTPRTGPFYVRGPVRFRWASTGWERGPMGYPVGDEESLPGLYASDNPDMQWGTFQHGIVFAQAGNGQFAPAAVASEQQVRTALFSAMDARMPAKAVIIGGITLTAKPGLYGVDLLGVDDWDYNFYRAVPRTSRVRVRGFVSISAPVPDPTFTIDLGLRFSSTWPTASFTYPSHKTIIATLVSTRIHVDGVFSETIANEIANAVRDTFQAGPGHPEVTGPSMVLATVPTGANQTGKGNLDLLEVMLAADGSLHVLVNPLPGVAGGLRRFMAQRALDSALDNL